MDERTILINVSGSYNHTTFNKFNVIDGMFGNGDEGPDICNCCFATDNKTTRGWLQLDLQKSHLVYGINVIGRSDSKYYLNTNFYVKTM